MGLRWPAEAIWEQVVPMLGGFTVEILPEIDSTNSELMRRARAGSTDPVLLVAERQTAGRGRMGRDWQSSPDAPGAGLTFSLGLALNPADWSGLSLAVGLSVVQSLHPSLRLKWPNDIWLDGRKLGGILIETANAAQQRYVVIGVGLNIHARDSSGLRTPAAALQELLPHAEATATLLQLVAPLVRQVQLFEQQGFTGLRSKFHGRDALSGQVVQCSDGVTGTARGVDAGGALLVHTAAGVVKISSAEVSVRPSPLP